MKNIIIQNAHFKLRSINSVIVDEYLTLKLNAYRFTGAVPVYMHESTVVTRRGKLRQSHK